MARYLFAGSSPADLGLSVDSTADPNHFDADYTQRAVYNPKGFATGSWYFPVEPEGGSRDFWYHVYFAGIGSNVGVGNNLWACRAWDFDGVLRGGWVGTGARTAVARAIGDSTVSGLNFNMPTAHVPVDVNIRSEPDKIVVEAYQYGALASRAEAALSGDIGPLKRLEFGPIRANAANFSDQITAQSEMVVTDGIPTAGARLVQRLPDSEGHYSDLLGSYENLADPNPAVGLVGIADGQRSSWGLSPVGATLGPAAIAAVIGSFSHSRMLGTPARVNQFMRISGEDFDSPSRLSRQRRTDVDSWRVNPRTGLKWDTADFLNLEVGIRVTE